MKNLKKLFLPLPVENNEREKKHAQKVSSHEIIKTNLS